MKLIRFNLILLFFILSSLTITALSLHLFFSQPETTSKLLTCPSTPKNVLEASQLKSISVTPFSTQLSDIITADHDLGYIFKANAGQKLKYNKLDDICVWLYTPNNQLMTSSTFPIDGKYIMQVATLKQSVNFDIYISLEVNPNIKQEIDKNLAKSSPTITPTSDPDTPEKTVFKELLKNHFESLSNQYYNIAWEDLSGNFQKTLKDARSYGRIWEQFNTIQLLELEIISQTRDRVSLIIQVEYSLDSQFNFAQGKIELLFDYTYSRWLIDRVQINLNNY